MIFGTEDILINNIAYLLRRVPVFGIPGSGSYRVRPVPVEDVADICVESGRVATEEVIDAVGPETFTFEELVRLIARTIGGRTAQSRSAVAVCVPGCWGRPGASQEQRDPPGAAPEFHSAKLHRATAAPSAHRE